MLNKVTFICIFFIRSLLSQQGEINGRVINAEDESPLYNVNILIEKTSLGTSTNKSGEFLLKNISPGNYLVSFSFIGFKEENIEVLITEGGSLYLEIKLEPETIFYKNIIVTSTKFEKNPEDVAYPLEVITEEAIQERNYNSLSDALSSEPGIALQRDGIWGTHLNIRGLSGQRIVALVDGNRIETATDLAAGLSVIDLNDIERVEVLKGAASSLYGTGALGGIVNIITKKKSFQNNFYFNGSLTSGYSSVNKNKILSLNIFSGNIWWFASLTGSLRNASDIKTANGILPNSGYEDENLSAKFGIKVLENVELLFQYQKYSAYDVGIPGGYPLFPSSAVLSYPYVKKDMFSAEILSKNILSGFNGSLKFYSQNIYRDVENIPNTFVRLSSPERIIYNQKILPNARHYTNGIQFQLDKLFYNSHYILFGVDVWKRNLDSRRERIQKIDFLDNNQQVINSVSRTTGERPIPESSFLSLGLFLQYEIFLIKDKLSVTIGGRVDQINISNEEVKQPLYEVSNGIRNDSPSNQTIIWEKRKAEDFSWSSNINLLYSFNKKFDLTFTASRSFRSPNLEERYQYIDQGALVRVGNPDLLPEEGYFIDAGIKLRNYYYNFSGNIFGNFLENFVVEKPGIFEGRAAQIKTNVGKARLYGFDFRFDLDLKTAIFYTNFSYVRGRDVEADENLPQIPPLNGKFGIGFNIFRQLNSDFSLTVFNPQNKIAEGELNTPGYIIFNWYLALEEISFSQIDLNIFAGIENLLNKSYRNHLSTNRGLITSEPGRNFFIKLDINW